MGIHYTRPATKKEMILFPIIVVGLIALILVIIFTNGNKNTLTGSTQESREQILNSQSDSAKWLIARELELDKYMVCGTTYGNQSGIALFTKTNETNYKYQSHMWNDSDTVLLTTAYVSETDTNYNVSWFNGAVTEYAEFIYTAKDGTVEKFKKDTCGMDIVYCESPFEKEYSLKVIYYDLEGNSYQ